MLDIDIEIAEGKQTVSEVSKTLYLLLMELSKVDCLFKNPILAAEYFKDIKLDLKADSEEVVAKIANTILKFNRKELLKYGDESTPSIHSSNRLGFTILVCYLYKNKELSFTFALGRGNHDGFGLLSIDGFRFTYDFGVAILRAIVDMGKSPMGVVRIDESDLFERAKVYQFPLGLVSYFNNDYEISIPDDLGGVEYEYTANGKYLFATRDNNASDEKILTVYKPKILAIMEELKQKSPEYEYKLMSA
ncbi:MAG: hypothetical protein OCC45_15735 [Desulfotalea sp.]